MDNSVLIIDDSQSALFMLESHLSRWGYNTLKASSAKDALEILKKNSICLIISDQVMPEMDGIELLNVVKKLYEDIPFIILTGHGSIDKAVVSMKKGADDYITKPYDSNELLAVIRRAINYRRMILENKELREYQGKRQGFQNIITHSPLMLKAINLAKKVAKSPETSVAVYGESGTGKELIARAIHNASGCLVNRFIAVNCAGIPSTLLESELFGHVKGAFTGADKDRTGKFGLAQNGTLLLDEIGDMHADLQAKLLRVLQERTYEMLGSDKSIKTNARIITATHQNLEDLVNQGKFRKDLFHRTNSYPINLIPLRDRKEDIHLLVHYFITMFRHEIGKPIPGVSQAAMEELENYHWPGNVRELKNCIERAAIINNGELIRPEHLNLSNVQQNQNIVSNNNDNISINIDLNDNDFSLNSVMDYIMEAALKKCNNNKAGAARLLKVDRKIFYRRKQTRE
ncbi:Two component system response regulator, sigma factor 54 interaction domain-containing [Desulfonema limicola]|uniref:Two component system response regulator, sigma factor 54 interaction domain-containing n=1 Tax=Desulfonema limicola TaxID=45656 RepID=A0A975BBR0_9BACT|nr:sigma-54 dependent transcriptional regulator [Desulfonema limicola]QTA82329.1 Two component system response regulator, sigma factor 54 interaction domain-containing [Desulfonema limicola]